MLFQPQPNDGSCAVKNGHRTGPQAGSDYPFWRAGLNATSVGWLCRGVVRAWSANEEVAISRQVLGGAAHFGSKSGSNDSLFVTNASGLKGNSPILIGLMEYFQVGDFDITDPLHARPRWCCTTPLVLHD